MKKLLPLLLFLISTSLFAQTNTSWYKLYNGTIGKTAFVLHLYKAGTQYDGWIYYKSTEQPYWISGRDQKGSTIELMGSPGGMDNYETWKLKFTGTGLSGSFLRGEKTTPLTATEQKSPVALSYVYTEGKTVLNKNKNAPEASYFASGPWFSPQTFLNTLLYPNHKGKTLGQSLVEEKNTFFREFKEENSDLVPADYEEQTTGYNQDWEEKTHIIYSSPSLLNVSAFTYIYSGGAHGNFGTMHSVVDLKNKKMLALTDIITDTTQLKPLLEKNYRLQYQIPAGEALSESLFVEKIPPTENFFLTPKCIGFSYVPYEIAAYAAGQITIYIPIEECKDLLTDKAKMLLSK